MNTTVSRDFMITSKYLFDIKVQTISKYMFGYYNKFKYILINFQKTMKLI